MYYVCMARVNVYLPDDLATAAREAGLNVSALTQRALSDALSQRATDAWLSRIAMSAGPRVSHEKALAALDSARDEFGE